MTLSISDGDGSTFKARPLGRGHYIPFRIKEPKSEPTRSVSPQTLKRSRTPKKENYDEPVSRFKAKPLPSFIKRRVSSSDICSKDSDGNASSQGQSNIRRKSVTLCTKVTESSPKITKPVPFSLRCDKLMSSRKQVEAERAERLRLAEQERALRQAELQRAKDAEVEEQLNKNMFKARPVPKYLSRSSITK